MGGPKRTRKCFSSTEKKNGKKNYGFFNCVDTQI